MPEKGSPRPELKKRMYLGTLKTVSIAPYRPLKCSTRPWKITTRL
jgi:hypothetical protein